MEEIILKVLLKQETGSLSRRLAAAGKASLRGHRPQRRRLHQRLLRDLLISRW